jgi:hypothetical protein
MILNKSEVDKVIGEIYKITNVINKKIYIGQTRSHRLNKEKYRPFGYMGRFKDHINECYSNKKNVCNYLNSAIIKYGKENFTCEKLIECPVDNLDETEIKYILEYNSKYPNGYNLTAGGKTCNHCIVEKRESTVSHVERPRNFKRSEETKRLISSNVKEAIKDVSHRKRMMEQTQQQHSIQKYEKFKNLIIDESNIEKYIHITNNNTLNYQYIKINIQNVKTTFVGKHETIDEIKNRAINFIKDLIKWRHNQIAGNSLEISLPLIIGNGDEELG